MKRSFRGKLKIAILCPFILAAVLFASCSSPPDFPNPPFECNIQWSFNSIDFTASLSAYDDSTELCLISPACLSGASLCIKGDIIRYTYQGITLDTAPEYYLAIAQIFREAGKFKFLCSTEIDGQVALCYSRGNTEWYFSKETKLPVLAKRADISVKILKVK